MIKREDVIVDPADPRAEGLIGKKVCFGNSYRDLVRNSGSPHVLIQIAENSSAFRSVSGYGYIMIAPVPEPTYRPFKSAEEFRPYRDKWFARIGKIGAINISSYTDKGAYCNGVFISWEKAFEDYSFEDGTPFGVKENN